MEIQNNVQKGLRTREQKQELISQWEKSGKSRKVFCEENGIGYNSLVGWCKQFKDPEPSTGFAEVQLTQSSALFAQVHLPGGIKIDFYQPIPADFIRPFVKA